MDKVLCAICEIDNTRPYKQEGGYQAVQCTQCGLVYVNPRPSIAEMKELYEGQETQIDLLGHIRGRDLKCIQARKCLELIQRYRSSGRLLEIGSAAGYFLYEARRAGFQVQGLDLTHPFVRFSEEVLGIPTFEGTLQQAPFASESFDIIYHRNVLSHLAHPLAEFAEMYRLLAPGGHLIFETGNVAELQASEQIFLELPDHLYHFGEVTIDALLKQTGFVHTRTHRFGLLSELPVIRAAGKLFKQRTLKARRERPNSADFPRELPPSSRLGRARSHLAQWGRYDLGRVLSTEGRRCTLVVVATRETQLIEHKRL